MQHTQQKMKDLHDRFAEPTKFQLGDCCWVFTPKQRKGLSRKLTFSWHGPYHIVEFLFPVHSVLRAVDNRHVSTTVHVFCMKRYIDPAARPTLPPLITVDEPYLADTDLPSERFAPEIAEQHPSAVIPSPENGRTDSVMTPELSAQATSASGPDPVQGNTHLRSKMVAHVMSVIMKVRHFSPTAQPPGCTCIDTVPTRYGVVA